MRLVDVMLIACRKLKVGEGWRNPGDPVPEFDDDPARRRRRDFYLENGWIAEVTSTEQPKKKSFDPEPDPEPSSSAEMTVKDVLDGLEAGVLDAEDVLRDELARTYPRKRVLAAAEAIVKGV